MGSQTTHPKKWRETCDPFLLPYHSFQPVEIIGYPHARNDVFQARGLYRAKEHIAYIKVARHKDSAIEHEAAILAQLNAPFFPKVIDAGCSPLAFSVTTALPGARLSTILGANDTLASLTYMDRYGEALGRIHHLSLESPPQANRRFHHPPPADLLEKLGLAHLNTFFDKHPRSSATVFCHGDFHYANILWEDHHISGILDFELSGYGNRDFDIAWAMFLRPGQRFMRTPEEQLRFLTGYSRYGEYDPSAVRYYMAQCYVYFLQFSDDDPAYCEYIRSWLASNCT